MTCYMESNKYQQKIMTNLKSMFKQGLTQKEYSFAEFCKDFYEAEELDGNDDHCMCNHAIFKRYKYKHKTNDDYFVLGCCCIKTFSEEYKKLRKCLSCQKKIKKNKSNMCKECKEDADAIEQQRIMEQEQKLLEELSYHCKECNYKMKTNKYRYCFLCFEKRKNKFKKIFKNQKE